MRLPRMLTMCVVLLVTATSDVSSSASVRAAPASSNALLDWIAGNPILPLRFDNGLALDCTGQLWVTDFYSMHILEFPGLGR